MNIAVVEGDILTVYREGYETENVIAIDTVREDGVLRCVNKKGLILEVNSYEIGVIHTNIDFFNQQHE